MANIFGVTNYLGAIERREGPEVQAEAAVSSCTRAVRLLAMLAL